MMKCGFNVVSRCVVCGKQGKSKNHLFITCPYVATIWDFIANFFSMRLVLYSTPLALCKATISVQWSSQDLSLWLTAIVTDFNSIWFAHNRRLHAYVLVATGKTFGFISRAIKEAGQCTSGTMHNSVHDLLLIRKLDENPIPPKSLKIIPVLWSLPDPYWLKINMDDDALGNPRSAGGGGIF